MKKMLIVLIFSFLVQFNAFADEAYLTFLKTPTGANLLSLIDDSNTKGSRTGLQSDAVLISYLEGILHSTQHINMSLVESTMADIQEEKKRTDGVKPPKKENECFEHGRFMHFMGAKSIAPIGLMKIPYKVTGWQKVSIIEKFLRDHPEKLHESAYTLIVQALTDAFKDSK